MLIRIMFLAFAAALAQASSAEEGPSSDVESLEGPSRRCGAILVADEQEAENPIGTRLKAPAVPGPYYQKLVQLDHIYPIGYHYGCSIGIPTMHGCVIQMINGKFLVVGPLLEDSLPRVKPVEVVDFRALGLGFLCSVGVPSIHGCMVQEINGKWLMVDPLRPRP